MRTDRAFSKCTECHFEYIMDTEGSSDEGSGMRRVKYRWLVTRDFLAIFFLIQLVICSIAFLIHGIDTNNCAEHSWTPFSSTNNDEHCDPSPGQNDVCGAMRKALLPCFIAVHDRSSYYIFGMVFFFAIVGILGCCIGAGNSAGCCEGSSDCGGCYWCLWCDCHHVDCSCPHGGCGNCDCDCGGDAGGVMLIVAAVVCVVLAFVGLILALFFMAMIIQRVMQRHMHVLQKRTLAAHYLVRDLDGQDLSQLQRTNSGHYDSPFNAPGQVEDPPPEYTHPSAPSLSPAEYNELKDAGLIGQA
eukprot:TRINITY_DN1625_c0_g1_i3.p1 TRINITY_DN1625_c0_g1~~TRINITY_DN1625_c0_g1_i3.p1  ORF type:complete len:300 (-),score=50.07 TRINITY_DN1625_c0_g1_i3:41-940(-)